MQEVKIYTASPSDLSPPVQSESFCVDMVLASDYAELEAKCAAMNCEDVLFNSDESFCVQFGNIYEAMLAAAPQHEVK
ncbi:TPA_asm: hypothetical protein G4I96_000613 [Salmonella enterica subsp. diarizonae serovar 50:l,v:z35]|nr:hypothetical protein [Salmonella enterica subsp. diarizonae serovar 50:l,v:z35]